MHSFGKWSSCFSDRRLHKPQHQVIDEMFITPRLAMSHQSGIPDLKNLQLSWKLSPSEESPTRTTDKMSTIIT
jgi:hypothetical protein